MDQALIDQIVSNVLAQLQPAPVRPVVEAPVAEAPLFSKLPAATVAAPKPQPIAIELTAPVITAELLAATVRAGQPLKIARRSVLTPSARDWLNTRKISWTQFEKTSGVSEPRTTSGARWQLIVQTVTPNVRALQESMKRQPEGWAMDLVGQPLEAAAQAVRAIGTAEYDGIAVISEYAEIIACRGNRNDRVRAAVITDRNQLELTSKHLGVNLVCINPKGKTFIELRNLLRDCGKTRPTAPTGWNT